VSNHVMFSDPVTLAGVASLSFLLIACSGAPGDELPQVVPPSRPDTLTAEPMPSTLDAAIGTLNRGLSGIEFHAMQVLGEEDAVSVGYRVAQWLQRHWLDSRDGALRGGLASVGFDDPSEMADAVLRSFWRRLHGRPVDLNGQVRRARTLWDEADVAARSVVFSNNAAHALVRQCSRRVPTSVADGWVPDHDALGRLERGLMPALQAALDHVTAPGQRALRATDYYRQYGGLVVGQRRIIYINGFHRAYLSLTLSGDTRERATEWRTRAVNVCDGGLMFFGAEYDPSAGQFEAVTFNAP